MFPNNLLHLAVLLLCNSCLAGSNNKRPQQDSNNLVPLVIWHGMGDNCCLEYGAGGFKLMVERLLPGIYVKSLQLGSTPSSDSFNSFFLNANTQIEMACEELSKDSKLKGGFNAIGFSQGSQFLLVQAQYYHDPYDEEEYQLMCNFLPDINQELVFNPVYKERLSNISNFVMVRFTNDGMVQPIASEWFGFYKPGQSRETYTLFESRIYTEDLLGLQYLNESGRLHFLTSNGRHLQFTMPWFMSNILPFINRTIGEEAMKPVLL